MWKKILICIPAVLTGLTEFACARTTPPEDAVIIQNARPVFDEVFDNYSKPDATPWNGTRSDSYLYEICMKIAGMDANYDDLITIAGYASSFLYSQNKWWIQKMPPPGRDDRISHSTGFRFNWQQKESPEDYWQGIKDCVYCGIPVYGVHKEGVLFIGYRDADKLVDRRILPLAHRGVDPDQWWSWAEFVDWYKNRSEGGWFGCYYTQQDPYQKKEAAIEVVKAMLTMATDDPRVMDNVTSGVAGIIAYADDVEDTDNSGLDQSMGGFFHEGWRGGYCIYPQMSGRASAKAYLRKIAPLFKVRVKGYLFIAAEEYGQAVEAWQEYENQLGQPLGPKQASAWKSSKSRKAGAAAIRDAAVHEQKALDALAKAIEEYGQ